MKADYAITIADKLVKDLTDLVKDTGMAEKAILCLCGARTLQDLIREELDNRKTWNKSRDARQHAAGREKGKPGRKSKRAS